ncbi:uncharacterized protein LOC143133165 isoform X3 [Alosa pseudoharengus]|uniref:uncharacterized protein LOC143133165 isoform X3 n=1 Tax=Alosa pseudoharengus TaxID=34774 RepID=UPI003F8CB97C
MPACPEGSSRLTTLSDPDMDRYRYFVFNQRHIVVLGILQVACAGLCLVCGCMDAFFRLSTTLSRTRAPVWCALIMAVPGVLALFASQRKNPLLVSIMMVSSLFSCLAVIIVFAYAGLTLSYGEEDDEIFDHHIPDVFALGRMVRGANATLLLSGLGSLLFSGLITLVSCRSLPFCACYDGRTGLETLVPQTDPSSGTELVCTWQAGGNDRLFNSPVSFVDRCVEQEQEPSKLPPYVRLT